MTHDFLAPERAEIIETRWLTRVQGSNDRICKKCACMAIWHVFCVDARTPGMVGGLEEYECSFCRRLWQSFVMDPLVPATAQLNEPLTVATTLLSHSTA